MTDVVLSNSVGPVKAAMDGAAQESGKRRLAMAGIQCTSKCSGCCKRLIFLTVAEAMVIYSHLVSTNAWEPVKSAAQALAGMSRVTDPISWFKMNISCPVLSPEGTCRAYIVRPSPCSTHFVTSDPKLCEPWSASSGEYYPVHFQDIESKYRKRIEANLEGHGILQMRLPMPLALLLAERVSIKSGLDLQQAVSMLFNET